MKEALLHFVWQHQHFNRENLQTADGQPLEILRTGFYNALNAGPDFSDARLLLDGTTWAGDVEIHIKSSDWQRHKHHIDPAYNAVVLHVVWQDDNRQIITRPDGTRMPVLELKERVAAHLLQQYERLMASTQNDLPCSPWFENIDDLYKQQMLNRTLGERLETKAMRVLEVAQTTKHDWNETAYRLLARYLGFKVNGLPFEKLAERLPIKVLQKHRHQLESLEALLFGQAGWLEEATEAKSEKQLPQIDLKDEASSSSGNDQNQPDDYFLKLQKEYRQLRQLHQLPAALSANEWKLLRLRPPNFPTIRLAQLAAFIYKYGDVFSAFLTAAQHPDTIKDWLVQASDYWQTHYLFGKSAKKHSARLGTTALHGLLINAVAPVLAAYGKYHGRQSHLEQALSLLEALPPEKNNMTKKWAAIGLEAKQAADSQAMIEWHQNYCSNKRCLQCSIGNQVMKLNKS